MAQLLWSLAGLACLLTAGLAFCRRRLVLLALLVSPASLLTLVTGQTGYFTAALLLFGLAILPRRPVLAGIAFGLLTLKPQLGVLLPVFLLARRDWATIAAATITALGLVAASCWPFPPRSGAFGSTLAGRPERIFFRHRAYSHHHPGRQPDLAGLAPGIAWAAQMLCGLAVAAAVWLCARRASYRHATAVLLAGMFLAVPHAYAYDSLPLIAAMALCLSESTPLWQILLGGIVSRPLGSAHPGAKLVSLCHPADPALRRHDHACLGPASRRNVRP